MDTNVGNHFNIRLDFNMLTKQSIRSAFFLAILLASGAWAADPDPPPPAVCTRRMALELTPDVKSPVEQEFLSSLLGNHPAYRLNFLADRDGWAIEVELSGPGPDYLCDDVVKYMRKDGRVMSILVR